MPINNRYLKRSRILWTLAFSFILLVSGGSSSVYAQNSTASVNASEWKTFNGDAILTDPVAQKILENIELSKQILYDIQNPQRIVTEKELFIDQQRKMAQQQLQEELDRINNRYADFTPRAAFAKYVAKHPREHHAYLWDLFEYLYSKVELAREARDNILANGGTRSDAQQAFIEHAATTKAERVQYANEMALKHGLVNKISNINHFNALPENTKAAFVAYMSEKGLGEFALNPIYDGQSSTGSITSVYGAVTTQEQSSEIITTNYPEDASVQNDPLALSYEDTSVQNNLLALSYEDTLVQNNLLALSYEEPTSAKIITLNGQEYETEDIQTMNAVSEFTLSAWVKPDYSKGSSEFTIISKDKAFKLTINNNQIPEKVVRFSIFDGIKWTTIESSSTVDEQWTHISAKFEEHVLSLYINGSLETAKQMEGIPTLNSYGFLEPQAIDGIYSESVIFYGAQQIIKNSDVSTQGFFSGSIDEIIVVDNGIAYTEILELCNKSQYFTS